MRLKNDFSWSFSRANTFSECQKRYWYTYYGAWEGWPKTPYDKRPCIDPLASYLYAMKNMQSIPTFVGTVVHNTIEHFLKNKKLPYSVDELLDNAKKSFETGLDEAKSDKWRSSPKKYTNLFETYYGSGVDDDTKQKGLEKIETSLKNWHASPVVQNLLAHPNAKIQSVEELSFFMLDGKYKIIVVIDLALFWQTKSGQKQAILFDWKTGAESDKTEKQLYCYALYANKVWKFPYSDIVISPFYLFSDTYYKIGAGQETTIEEEKVEETEKMILDSCDMLSKLHTKTDEPELFSYTEDRSRCRICPFKELCEKAEYTPQSKASLKEKLNGCTRS